MDQYQKMSETKSALQQAFRAKWNKAGRRGSAGAATGVGKTKPAIDEMMDRWMDSSKPPPSFMVAVPTEDMRDVNWPAEVKEWYGQPGLDMWEECVTCVCYVSLHKWRSKGFDLVILDECHHLTLMSSGFFNSDVDVMGLSATFPDPKRDPDKWLLLNQICPEVFTYSLEQGVEDEIVAPFTIHIVQIPLDNIHKNIEAGPKDKKYMTTEAARYNALSAVIKKMYAQKQGKSAEMMILKRRQFLMNLPSKLAIARALIFRTCHTITGPPRVEGNHGVRTLIFCGSIKQADELMGEYAFHSKKKKKVGVTSMLDRFRAEEFDTLAVVSAVDEGINIPNLDQVIIVNGDSNPRTLVQRIGRVVRWREGHHAEIWILVTIGSQDAEWLDTSLKSFDADKIIYHSHTEFLSP